MPLLSVYLRRYMTSAKCYNRQVTFKAFLASFTSKFIITAHIVPWVNIDALYNFLYIKSRKGFNLVWILFFHSINTLSKKSKDFNLVWILFFTILTHFPKKCLLQSASMSLLTQYEQLVKCSKFTKNI